MRFIERQSKREIGVAGLLTGLIIGATGTLAVSSFLDNEPDEVPEPAAVIAERTITNGLLTEVFEDCNQWRVLEAGQVVLKNEISCDGGSFIVVEGERIQTSAGFTIAEEYYEVDVSGLVPGERVDVVFNEGEFGKNLDCDDCTIELSE